MSIQRNLRICRIFSSSLKSRRFLMTTQSRYEKALEKLESNSYFEKYAEKIAKLQKTSPEEFLSRVDQLEKQTAPKNSKNVVDAKFSQLLNPKKPLKNHGEEDTSLEKIMKLELISDKTSDEIKEIWQKYHIEKDFISAVVPTNDFEEMTANSSAFPTFILPLPRTQGYEFIMLQFQGKNVHFTPLLYYQVHKENAPECLKITHYTEFSDKGIVLMRGEYDKNIIDMKEAQCLANELLLYYVRPNQEKLDLLQKFTKEPNAFKHMDLIKQIENLSL